MAGFEVVEDASTDAQFGAIAVADTDERIAEATGQAAVGDAVLEPRKNSPVIDVPYTETTVIAQSFSLQLVTEEAAFRELGRRLAVDPERYLRRTIMDAAITTDAEGHRVAEMRTGDAQERIEAVQVVEDPGEARQRVIAETMQSRVVQSRPGERAQVDRLLHAVLDGAGDKADLLLTHYPDRVVQGMVREIVQAQRKLPRKTQTSTVVGRAQFAPTRMRRAKASQNRRGKFTKGVAYEGWKRGMYDQAWFDSKPERDMASLLDGTDAISIWVRLNRDDLPILWNGAENNYNPDLLAIDKSGTHWIIEIKADRDASNEEVLAKRQAALAWSNAVSESGAAQWKYLFIAERDLKAAKDSWNALVKATGA